MYTTIRKYYIVPGSASELKRRVQADFEPLVSCLPGFVAYYLLDVSIDEVVSISIFESKGYADIASGPTAFWTRDFLDGFVLGLPEITTGQTEVYHSVQGRSSQSDRQQVVTEPLMGII